MTTLASLNVGDRVAYVERYGYGSRLTWGWVTRILPAYVNGGHIRGQLQDELEMRTDDGVTCGGPIGHFTRKGN